MTNLDEFRDEHLADKAAREEDRAALVAAREAGERLWHMEARDREREARIARERPVWEALRDEVVNPTGPHKEHRAEYRDGKLYVDGVDVSRIVSFEQTWSRGSGIFHRGSKVVGERLVVGNYGERVNYPRRKDGTYNYEAVARALVRYAVSKNMTDAHERARRANAGSVSALREELGLRDYTDFVRPSGVAELPVQVRFEINRAMTADGARALYAALKMLGLEPKF